MKYMGQLFAFAGSQSRFYNLDLWLLASMINDLDRVRGTERRRLHLPDPNQLTVLAEVTFRYRKIPYQGRHLVTHGERTSPKWFQPSRHTKYSLEPLSRSSN